MSTCSRCPQPHDNWPSSDGGTLCQDCWEAESSAAWRAAMRAFDDARLLDWHQDSPDMEVRR